MGDDNCTRRLAKQGRGARRQRATAPVTVAHGAPVGHHRCGPLIPRLPSMYLAARRRTHAPCLRRTGQCRCWFVGGCRRCRRYLFAHCSHLTAHDSRLTAHVLLHTAPVSLLTFRCSRLIAHCTRLTAHFSLLTCHCTLPAACRVVSHALSFLLSTRLRRVLWCRTWVVRALSLSYPCTGMGRYVRPAFIHPLFVAFAPRCGAQRHRSRVMR